MEKLFSLLELQRRIFEAQSRDHVLHLILNDSKKIIPYDQALFFKTQGFALTLERGSGNTQLDYQAEYATKRTTLLKKALKESSQAQHVIEVTDGDIYAIILPLKTDQEGSLGAIWFERSVKMNEAEQVILDELIVVFSQVLGVWRRRDHSKLIGFLQRGRLQKWAIVAFVLFLIFPVHLSVSGPAEIVPRKADVITVPFDGIIRNTVVIPGAYVKEGDVVAEMDNDALVSQAEIAQQAFLTVQASLARVERESLVDPTKKIKLLEIRQDMLAKEIERDYALSLKQKSQIRAKRSGIAIFEGEQSLRGKPVSAGDKLMLIADTSEYELLIRVPVESMIDIKEGALVKFFLNVNPLSSKSATVRSAGYRASADPDGLFSYKVFADIDPSHEAPRIGWKGIARIEGNWTVLSYAILRKPILSIRKFMGL